MLTSTTVVVGDKVLPLDGLKLDPAMVGGYNQKLLTPDGTLKDGDQEDGDIILVEYPKFLTFFEIREGKPEYVTSVSRTRP